MSFVNCLILLASIGMANCLQLGKYIQVDGDSKKAHIQYEYGIINNLTQGALKIAIIGDSRASCEQDFYANGHYWPRQLSNFFIEKGWEDKIDLINYSKGRVRITDPKSPKYSPLMQDSMDDFYKKLDGDP